MFYLKFNEKAQCFIRDLNGKVQCMGKYNILSEI